jgi:hypothetical protein
MRAWVMTFALVACGSVKEELGESKRKLAEVQVKKIASEWYPRWAIASVDAGCPKSVAELGATVRARNEELQDPWGNPYELDCKPDGMGVRAVSRGPDGQPGTADDISSR